MLSQHSAVMFHSPSETGMGIKNGADMSPRPRFIAGFYYRFIA
jgi:hypothetical protein